MAFVRKTRTSSGAVAVQAVEKDGGKLRVIKHFGSAHTDAELGVLLERAHEFLGAGQPMLDLDVPEPTHRVSDVADWRAGQLPVPRPERTTTSARRGRIAGTYSRLIYDGQCHSVVATT